MYNILVCDDERDIVNAIEIYLGLGEEYKVLKAYNGAEAVEVIKTEEVHLAILDVMMPKLSGIEAMEQIRGISNIPIILLTAKSEDSDKIEGLNSGADDYITKPFNPVELMARVKSALRRYTKLGSAQISAETVTIGSISIDDRAKRVLVDGSEVRLTPTEYDILKLLMDNAGKVFSPKDIYRNILSETPYGVENTVAVHIRHLREKIEINPKEPQYLKVVWGQGYKFSENGG